MEEGRLQCFLTLRMNVVECANTHALCFERRTRVLEEIFLIYLYLGYGDATIGAEDNYFLTRLYLRGSLVVLTSPKGGDMSMDNIIDE